jgi:ribosomal protein L20A (L18A)
MAAPRGPFDFAQDMLAINRDDVRDIVTQRLDSGSKAAFEQVRIKRIDHVVQCIVRRDAVHKRQKTSQKIEPVLTSKPNLDKILHPRQRRALHQQQHLTQWIKHPPLLAVIAK